MERSHVSEYEDKAEIIELVNLYAFALDSHRWDLFDRIFTDDVRQTTDLALNGRPAPTLSARSSTSTSSTIVISTR
jgi:hypothetical protein